MKPPNLSRLREMNPYVVNKARDIPYLYGRVGLGTIVFAEFVPDPIQAGMFVAGTILAGSSYLVALCMNPNGEYEPPSVNRRD